jgi:hypothetical protein
MSITVAEVLTSMTRKLESWVRIHLGECVYAMSHVWLILCTRTSGDGGLVTAAFIVEGVPILVL